MMPVGVVVVFLMTVLEYRDNLNRPSVSYYVARHGLTSRELCRNYPLP
jgi:hypothetical protein